MGLSKQSGFLGVYEDEMGEKLVDGVALGEENLSDSMGVDQESLAANLGSHAAEELKFTLEVSGIEPLIIKDSIALFLLFEFATHCENTYHLVHIEVSVYPLKHSGPSFKIIFPIKSK